jgi:hypothetical protein
VRRQRGFDVLDQLAQHDIKLARCELDDRVDRHALLIGRLLDVTPMAQPRDDDT